jgi:hypothetical protein
MVTLGKEHRRGGSNKLGSSQSERTSALITETKLSCFASIHKGILRLTVLGTGPELRLVTWKVNRDGNTYQAVMLGFAYGSGCFLM